MNSKAAEAIYGKTPNAMGLIMSDADYENALSIMAATQIGSDGPLGDARADAFMKGYAAALQKTAEQRKASRKIFEDGHRCGVELERTRALKMIRALRLTRTVDSWSSIKRVVEIAIEDYEASHD